MSKIIYKNIKIFLFLSILLLSSFNNANELLIYADSISYDEDENIVARGNAKIFHDNKYIFSNLIIYKKLEKKIILPSKFIFKDERNNYYEGENGYFIKEMDFAEFNKPKLLLNDGSRIIGNKIKRDGYIDIITKGVYTPCNSRIKIGNFICPTWQLEGEKILHDNNNLFLYQKHSKMRVLNTPVFYIPYLVTPSPLRKERKSGFLSTAIALNFFDTKTSQSISFPYYFNIAIDKELLFTPTIPASNRLTKNCCRFGFVVQMDANNPNSVSLAKSIAFLSSSNSIMDSTGPKISSRHTGLLWSLKRKHVGSK